MPLIIPPPGQRAPIAAAVLAVCLSAGSAAPAAADWVSPTGLAIEQSRVFIDPASNRWYLEVRVQNSATEALTAPLRLVVAQSNLPVHAPDGTTADGKPYFALPVAGAGLAPGARTGFVRVQLVRAGRTAPRVTLAVQAEDTPFPLQLLHVADIDSTSATAALTNVKNFSALLGYFRADPAVGPYSVTLSSGDNWIPGPRYSAAADPRLAALLGVPGNGRGDVAMLNAMGFRASALGNHELDQGPGAFAGILTAQSVGAATWPGADFPYLSVNLDFATEAATAPLVAADGQPAVTMPGRLAGFATLAVQGQTIGLVGASTPTLRRITTPGGITIFPADPNDLDALAGEIQYGIDQLRAAGVNKVILLAHMQQISVEVALASRLSGVDIIVAGGSNTRLFDGDDVPWPGETGAGPYPIQASGADGQPVLIVNTDGDYKYLGRLVTAFDPRGVIDLASLDESVNGAWATFDDRLADLGLSSADADPTLAAIADQLRVVVEELRANVLGKAAVFLDGERNTVRRQESNLGNLSADANLWVARQSDPTTLVSIKNGGGIRAFIGQKVYPPGSTDPSELQLLPPPDGLVTQLDVQQALAFNNGLTLLTLTAAELQATVEHGVAASTPTSTPGQFPQVGGLRFSWDMNQPAGARVRTLAVVDDSGAVIDLLVRDGQLQGDPNRTFRTVTLNFLADGGDGYPLTALSNPQRLDLARAGGDPRTGDFTFAPDGSEQDALAEYLGAFFAEVPYDLPEIAPGEDLRIQDLTRRDDTAADLPAGAVTFARVGGLALGGAEILTWDTVSKRLFVVGPPVAGTPGTVRIVSLADPADPVLLGTLDPAADVAAAVPGFVAGDPTSVSYKAGLLAVALPANPATSPGQIAFYDGTGTFLGAHPAGALPDMVTWDRGGNRVLAANEGEPAAGVDPEGSVTVIDVPPTGDAAARVAGAVAHQLDLRQFNGQEEALRLAGVRIFPGKAAANDFEPEYIALSADDGRAFVALQEANSLAVVDLGGPAYAIEPDLIPLGTKDHSLPVNALDASDRDGPGNGPAINVRPWSVRGMYMPDGIAAYDPGLGRSFVLTANEGDARDETQRIGHSSVVLEPTVFPDAATLKQNANLGRLDLSTIDGRNAAGRYEALYIYGARSFTVWDLEQGRRADSGDDLARVTAQQTPTLFNANEGNPAEFDGRSDNKGAEPEAVTVGRIDERHYAFVGLERAGGGFMVYDVTNPHLPRFVSYTPGAPDDIALEGLVFIPAAESPSGRPLVVTANEVTHTLGVYQAQ